MSKSPRGGEHFLSKLKNREEFVGGLEKRKGKGGKRRKRMIKHTFMKLKWPQKKSTKTGKNFRGGGEFSGWPEYIPLPCFNLPLSPVLNVLFRSTISIANHLILNKVCELDIIFNFEKAYFMLDEFIIGGEVQETSKKNVLKAIAAQDLIQEVCACSKLHIRNLQSVTFYNRWNEHFCRFYPGTAHLASQEV